METEHFEFDLAENRVDFSYETALLRAITEGERDLYDDPVVVDQIYKSVDDLKRDNLHRESIDLSTRRGFSKEVALSWINLGGAKALMRNLDKFQGLDLEVAKSLAIKGVLHSEGYSFDELSTHFGIDEYLISYLFDCSEKIGDYEEDINAVISEINSFCNSFNPRNLGTDDEKIMRTAQHYGIDDRIIY